MPYQITFENLPMGHAAKGAREGTTLSVRCTEFVSTEDGQEFIRRLEELPNSILNSIFRQSRITFPPSQIDHLLGIIRPDRTATVYVNELQITIQACAGRPLQAGDPICKDDIVDITG